ncbi:G_PROTEIN_RECEP_F1_2 domain-containing protein [Meloidogyne graminicola]|uniref:G_PROTEIN_RECEP_F1_2 domain-containing protein n=1 Tax=Meloidogyne graminicola TaxID=189291 RepID=A0A8T0A1S2_9BILA|nr:G_PROTEIN_RECEP_F1_2 domain-containing protein [Meloidogyne graminicola]
MSKGNYSIALENYRQNGDICAYLNITTTTKSDIDNLEDKLNVLDIYQNSNKSFLQIYFPTIAHQLIVGECSFNFTVKRFFSQWYYDNVLIWYDERGTIKPIIPYIIIPSIFAFLSIFLNLSLIFVSIQKISMERMCNILILFDAFCQLFTILPLTTNMIALLFNIVLIDYRICFFIHLISTIAAYSSFLSIYFISFERFLIIIYPTKVHKICTSNVHRISFVVCIICILFGIIMTLIKFNVWTILNLPYYRFISKKLKEKKVVNDQTIWNKKNNINKSIPDPALRILRSVFFITSIIVLGWIIGSVGRNSVSGFCGIIANFIGGFFTETKTSQSVTNNVFTILVSIITCINPISVGINAVILFISNSEYRNAYKTAFGIKQQIQTNSIGPYFTNNNS